jgi:hypothetical protein
MRRCLVVCYIKEASDAAAEAALATRCHHCARLDARCCSCMAQQPDPGARGRAQPLVQPCVPYSSASGASTRHAPPCYKQMVLTGTQQAPGLDPPSKATHMHSKHFMLQGTCSARRLWWCLSSFTLLDIWLCSALAPTLRTSPSADVLARVRSAQHEVVNMK